MNIVWTDYAQRSQDAVAEYIMQKFGALTLRDFYDNIDNIEWQLSEFPNIGRVEPLLEGRGRLYRSIVVTKQSKVIYYIDGSTIFIVDFWDTRREPEAQADKLN